MSENKFEWVIDLDSKEFSNKLVEAVERVENLSKTLESLATVAGALGAAYLAVKAAFNLEKEAEQVKQIEMQFQQLAKSVNVSAEALESGLKTAAKGLVDDTELLAIANRGMVEFGANSARLPEILDLARKSTQVFGGELVQNFETLSRAIAFGQERTLKQYGLTVDVTKAVQEYAKTNGIAASAVSEQGRQQAILNAVLAQGQTKYKGVTEDNDKLTNSTTRVTVALNQMYETLAKFLDRMAGGTIRQAGKDMADFANILSEDLKSIIGTGAEQAEANINSTRRRITELQADLYDLQKAKDVPWYDAIFGVTVQSKIEETKKSIQLMEGILDNFEAKAAAAKGAAPAEAGGATGATGGGVSGISGEDARKAAEQRIQADQTASQIEESNVQKYLSNAQSKAEVELYISQLKEIYGEQEANREAQLLAQKEAGTITKMQYEEQLMLVKEQHQLRVEELARSQEQAEMQALENRVRANKDSATVVGDAWQLSTQRMIAQQSNWAATVNRIYGSVQNRAVAAFEAVGAGQKTAAEAAKGFILGVLADEAIARGTILLMSGIASLDPAKIAGGGALIAFGGYLKSQAAGKSNLSAGSVGGGAGGERGDPFGGANREDGRRDQPEKQTRNTTLIIQGNVFDTEATRTRIAELVREADDSTGFSVQRT